MPFRYILFDTNYMEALFSDSPARFGIVVKNYEKLYKEIAKSNFNYEIDLVTFGMFKKSEEVKLPDSEHLRTAEDYVEDGKRLDNTLIKNAYAKAIMMACILKDPKHWLTHMCWHEDYFYRPRTESESGVDECHIWVTKVEDNWYLVWPSTVELDCFLFYIHGSRLQIFEGGY